MNTLDDLRSTLESHADGLDDTERYARPVAVHARIRAVRRRRAGLAAAAAAVVLLAGVATVDSLRTPDTVQPADHVVVGVDVPATIDVLDFPYALRDLHELDDAFRVQPSDGEQAVALAASGLGSGSATLYADGEAVARLRGDQQVAAPYPIGDGGTGLEVRFSGTGPGARAGVAVYAATGEMPDGVSDGTSVFRDTVAGNRLITAAFAAPGTTSVTVQASGPLDQLQIASRCSDATEGIWFNLSVDGDGPVQWGQCSDGGVDNTPSATLGSRDPGRHTFTAYATRGENGPRVPVDELGVGLYATEPATPVGNASAAATVESAGRTWRLTETLDATQTVVDTADGDRLVGFAASAGRAWITWRGDLDDGRSSEVGGGGTIYGPVLLAGDRYQVTLHQRAATGQARILVYRPE